MNDTKSQSAETRFALKLNVRRTNGILVRHDLSTNKFAAAIGFESRFVGKVLRGEAHPSDKFIAAVSAVFSIPVYELIDSKPVVR